MIGAAAMVLWAAAVPFAEAAAPVSHSRNATVSASTVAGGHSLASSDYGVLNLFDREPDDAPATHWVSAPDHEHFIRFDFEQAVTVAAIEAAAPREVDVLPARRPEALFVSLIGAGGRPRNLGRMDWENDGLVHVLDEPAQDIRVVLIKMPGPHAAALRGLRILGQMPGTTPDAGQPMVLIDQAEIAIRGRIALSAYLAGKYVRGEVRQTTPGWRVVVRDSKDQPLLELEFDARGVLKRFLEKESKADIEVAQPPAVGASAAEAQVRGLAESLVAAYLRDKYGRGEVVRNAGGWAYEAVSKVGPPLLRIRFDDSGEVTGVEDLESATDIAAQAAAMHCGVCGGPKEIVPHYRLQPAGTAP